MAERAMSMTEIGQEIERRIGVKPVMAKNVIKAMVEIAQDEVSAGRPFSVPHLVKIAHGYRGALKKGREVRDPKTGDTFKADKARPAQITVKARVLAATAKAAPSPTSKAGKPIADAGKQRIADAAARKAEREAAAE